MTAKMKIGHIADGHAGYESTNRTDEYGVNLRALDGFYALESCVTDMIEQDIDAVIYGGDVFHKPNPSIRTILEVQTQFRRLAAAGIKIYALAGNHDASDVKADIAANRILDDDMRGIFSHVEPYAHHEIGDGVHVHLVSHHMYHEQYETMKKVQPIAGEINIFTTHGSVVNPVDHQVLHTESSPREIVVPNFLLEDRDWSYTMLGHIHERGWVGSSDGLTDTANRKIFYNGSLLRRGFSDNACPLGRGWTMWTIEEDGTFNHEFRNIWERPQEDFPVLDASTMNSHDLSEIMIQNLRNSVDKNSTDMSNAPILRQRVSNLTPAIRSGLDWSTIDSLSSKAFQWSLKVVPAKEVTEENANGTTEVSISDFKEADLLKEFNRWSEEESETLKAIKEKEDRDTVKNRSREFISVAQDEVFADEE